LAVKLRLRRMGKKKQPIYKVVAADSRAPRDGKFLEAVGLYNPLTKPHTIEINEERALYWLSVGAQPTDTVKSLFRQKGINLKHDLSKRGLSEEKINEEVGKWEKLQEAKTGRKIKSAKTEITPVPQPIETEQVVTEKAEEEISNDISTAEVTGAASEENTSEDKKE